ncbi:MAG: TRAP transporter large permease [Comamonas sp.]
MELERSTIGVIGVAITLLLVFIRVPIGVAMGVVGVGGVAVLTSWSAAFGVSKAIPYEVIGDWNLSAVPMFLLMGYIASSAGLTKGLFTAARIFLGRVPGALGSSTVVASALFSSAAGSSVATAAAFSRISVPEMLKAKYDPALATGCVAAAGTLGSMIPPSVLMIVYGILADVSISQMFMAGIVPGILTAAMFIAYVTIRAVLNPKVAPRDTTVYSKEEKAEAFRDLWPMPVIILCVLGGIFSGIFTATEAGAIGAAIACLIAAARKALTKSTVLQALKDTAEGTATIFIIVVGASIFSRFMSFSQLPAVMSDWMMGITDSQLTILLAVAVIYLLLGTILESVSIMLLTIPLLMPMLQATGIDLIWFGIIVIKLLEIGLCTPPVGMNVYVIKSSLGNQVPLGTIFRGVGWFIAVDLITLGLLMAFPQISLWLPSLMAQ